MSDAWSVGPSTTSGQTESLGVKAYDHNSRGPHEEAALSEVLSALCTSQEVDRICIDMSHMCLSVSNTPLCLSNDKGHQLLSFEAPKRELELPLVASESQCCQPAPVCGKWDLLVALVGFISVGFPARTSRTSTRCRSNGSG